MNKPELPAGTIEGPFFVAFAYPGWHPSPYRPGVDEWDLLARFQPYFEGHLAPPMPASGRYNDAVPATAREHVRLATQAGISAFMYFLYYGKEGFVMDDPMKMALAASAECDDDFSVAGTWCVRLPHNVFPVAPSDELDMPALSATSADIDIEDKPIESLTLRDLETLLADDRWWSDILLSYEIARPRTRRMSRAADNGSRTFDAT
ncbi:glycoside hydrolase family 99-like domain-containing protein [Trinickia sp. LjRoot230]|uniref:glycoside hydrolase family 99-like domain-containing protein n=1 Tax=Trinickia sp. LjRoot230 TaxID=3342288 RepID=UPI003ECE36C9